MRATLAFIHEYRDRHGKLRRYFRKRGHPRIALKGRPGSPEFMAAYNAALASLAVREICKDSSAPGTVSAAIAGYYTHNSFLGLAPTTARCAARFSSGSTESTATSGSR